MEINNYNHTTLVNKIRNKIIEEAKTVKFTDLDILNHHLLEVEKFANKLCDEHKEANKEIVMLSVWLHDVGRLRGIDKGHDEYGANEAKKILLEENVPENIIEGVYNACRSHSCNEIKPEIPEGKILSTADAMSHFTHGFYFRLLPHLCKTETYEEARNFIVKKVQKDFSEKIAFDEGRNEVKDKYNAILTALEE